MAHIRSGRTSRYVPRHAAPSTRTRRPITRLLDPLAAGTLVHVLVLGLVGTVLTASAARSTDGRGRRERGDVPGWVLVTIMTAGLVIALWNLADKQLTSLFTKALTSVKGP